MTGKLTAKGGIDVDASNLTVNGTTKTSSLSVTNTTTLTGKLTANGGIEASSLTVNGATKTSRLSVTGADGLSVTKGATTLTGKLTANGGIEASSLTVSGDIISSTGNVTGKIGKIDKEEKWSDIASTDTIATGFAKTNYGISNLMNRMDSAEGKLEKLGSQPITKKSDFGGTGQAVASIDDLVDVLDDIFRGNETVLGMIKSANGFYATGGV